jgi:hypothetical protein
MARQQNLVIDQGSTFSVTIDISNIVDNSLDLSTYTAKAQMRKSYGSSSYTEFFVAMNDDNAEKQITLSLTSQQTTLLRQGRYVYDVEIENDDGIVKRIIEGIITVTPEVTR